MALKDILQQFGCLDDLDPTEVGRTVAALRGDNELWLGLALMSGHLDELDPPNLAAVFEAISTEVNRPDLWSGFPPLAPRKRRCRIYPGCVGSCSARKSGPVLWCRPGGSLN